jgi:hypothetical protein
MKKVKISTFNQAFTYGISYFSCIFSSSKGLPLKHFILKWQLLKKELNDGLFTRFSKLFFHKTKNSFENSLLKS